MCTPSGSSVPWTGELFWRPVAWACWPHMLLVRPHLLSFGGAVYAPHILSFAWCCSRLCFDLIHSGVQVAFIGLLRTACRSAPRRFASLGLDSCFLRPPYLALLVLSTCPRYFQSTCVGLLALRFLLTSLYYPDLTCYSAPQRPRESCRGSLTQSYKVHKVGFRNWRGAFANIRSSIVTWDFPAYRALLLSPTLSSRFGWYFKKLRRVVVARWPFDRTNIRQLYKYANFSQKNFRGAHAPNRNI